MLTIYYRKPEAVRNDPLAVHFGKEVVRKDYDQVAKVDEDWDLEEVFREMNVVDGNELPVELKIRSMMVGDVVEMESGLWLCASAGWRPVEWCKSTGT